MIDWVRDNLLDVLLQDLEAQLGRQCGVKFVVRERAREKTWPRRLSFRRAHRSHLPSPVRAAAFVPAAPDQLKYTSTRSSSSLEPVRGRRLHRGRELSGEGLQPLFLYGGVGLGKTHLVHAVGNHALRQTRTATWCTCPRSRSRTT